MFTDDIIAAYESVQLYLGDTTSTDATPFF